MLLPRQVAKLPSLRDRCECGLKWHCESHNTCFIHDSCFCKGSSSFPPIKPLHSSWSQFLYNWYVELVSSLEKHPYSPLSCIVLEVEHRPFVIPYYHS